MKLQFWKYPGPKFRLRLETEKWGYAWSFPLTDRVLKTFFKTPPDVIRARLYLAFPETKSGVESIFEPSPQVEAVQEQILGTGADRITRIEVEYITMFLKAADLRAVCLTS